jgi:hypothetical protein
VSRETSGPARTKQYFSSLLKGTTTRSDAVFTLPRAPSEIQQNIIARANMPLSLDEVDAILGLSVKPSGESTGPTAEVTNLLEKNGAEFFLEVHVFQVTSLSMHRPCRLRNTAA